MFCLLARLGATLGYRSHCVLNILYLKREETQSLHLLLLWDRKKTQNRPKWQLLFKRPHKGWCQDEERSPSGKNPPECQENSETTSCPACTDFSDHPIQKASPAISKHTLSLPWVGIPQDSRMLFSVSKTRLWSTQIWTSSLLRVICFCSVLVFHPEAWAAQGHTWSTWRWLLPRASSRKRDSSAPLKKLYPLASPKWHISLVMS